MIKKKYKFSVGTRYCGSDYEDEVEVEFTEEQYNNECEREKVIQEYYEDWVWENTNTNWEEVEE